MTTARQEMLQRIRAALLTAVLPMPAEPALMAAPVGDTEDLVDVFRREAEAVGAVVHGPVSPSEAAACITRVLRAAGARRLLTWNPAEMGVAGLAEDLEREGFETLDPRLPVDPANRAKALLQLGEAEVGLTGASAGLADTGTLVLRSGPGRPRLACLLPPVHVALLPARLILPSLADFLSGAAQAAMDHANLVLISGPSRTGDIELTLLRGMHGPREVHIIVLADSKA